MVTGVDRKDLLDHPAETRRLLGDAVAVLDSLAGNSSFTLDQVSEMHWDQAEGFILTTLDGGVPIRLGYSNFADKIHRLERIYPQLQGRLAALKYIDLNVPDRVIVRVDSSLALGKS